MYSFFLLDEAGIPSSGTPSYLRKDKGHSGTTDLWKVDYLVANIGEGGGKYLSN